MVALDNNSFIGDSQNVAQNYEAKIYFKKNKLKITCMIFRLALYRITQPITIFTNPEVCQIFAQI